MECSVTYRGKPSGMLRIERQNLYYRCTAECAFRPQKPLHLYAVRGMKSVPLGVISEDGTLRKTVSVRMMGELPNGAVLGEEDNGFFPWSGVVDAERITDAYLKDNGETQLLALPAADGAEVPLVAYAQQMQTAAVCGRPCLVLTLFGGEPKQTFFEKLPEEEMPPMPENE